VRIVENGFPCKGSFAETVDVTLQVADLLGMAIGAPLAGVYSSAAPFTAGKGQRLFRRRLLYLMFERAAGPDS
jgi:hypothetical protein